MADRVGFLFLRYSQLSAQFRKMLRLTRDDLSRLVEAPVDLEHVKIFPSRRSVFVLDGNIVVAYNAKCPYPSQISQNLDKFPLRRLHLPTHASNDTPYLCAAPAIPDYSGPILGRLAQTESHFPIVKNGSDFVLESSVAKAWKDLEEALRAISRVLTLSAQSYLSLDYKFPPAPSSYGYMGGFPSRQSAVVACQRSRDSFQALMAHVSWSALVHRNRHMFDIIANEKTKRVGTEEIDALSLDTEIFDNDWKDVLLKQGVHPAWIHELSRCTLCDFNITRAGIILRVPQEWAYHHLLPVLILSHVPIWMIWGHPQTPTTCIPWSKSMKSSYGPNDVERRFAQTWKSSLDVGNVRIPDTSQSSKEPAVIKATENNVFSSSHEIESQPLSSQSPSNAETSEFNTQLEHSEVVLDDAVRCGETTAKVKDVPANSSTGTLGLKVMAISSSLPIVAAQRPKPLSPLRLYHEFPEPPAQDTQPSEREKQERSEDVTRSASNNGLHIHQWLRLQIERITSSKASASLRQLHKYRQRELAALKYKSPGRKGARVFEWVRDELDRPARIHVPRVDVDQTWDMYGDKQRWYNCVRDEWELCIELDPSDTPDPDTTSTLSCDGPDIGEAQASGYLLGWRNAPSDEEAHDINTRLSASWDFKASTCLYECELDVLDLLSGRFGFAYTRGRSYIPLPKPQWSLSKSLRLLGDCKGKPTFFLPEGLEAPAIQFVMHLSAVGHPDSPTSTVPGILCDLSPYNKRYLGGVISSVTIHTAKARGYFLYILIHRNSDENAWALGVTDPCVALLAIRSNPFNLRDFATYLIQTRTPFYTLRRSHQLNCRSVMISEERRVGRRFGLGERPIGHNPDRSDYIAYTGEKSRLLLNPRIARAAVKRGGILSRLVDSLVEERDVLDGPSVSADECPFSALLCVDGQEIVYIDDDITEEESSVLVGLYRIKPGEHALLAVRLLFTNLLSR